MKLSIITPSFNQLDYLTRCILSVRDQCSADPLLDVEHIVQDAGSRDLTRFLEGTLTELRIPFCHYRDGAIRVEAPIGIPSNYRLSFFEERDDGMYDAINRGLRRAKGEILAYLNCDEQYLPKTLSATVRAAEMFPNAEIFFGDSVVIAPDGSPIASRPALLPRHLHTILSGSLSVFTASMFFRRRLLNEPAGFFDASFRMISDADWIGRQIARSVPMRLLGVLTSAYTQTGSNLSNTARAAEERQRLAFSTPSLLRLLRPFVICAYRLQRLLNGHYFQKGFSYAVYTKRSLQERETFRFENPSPFWNDLPLAQASKAAKL